MRRASFFDHSPLVPVFAPTSPHNLEYLLAVSKNLAHPLHAVYDDGKGAVAGGPGGGGGGLLSSLTTTP